MSSSDSSADVYRETLAVFGERKDPAEPLTTPEVADTLDVARRTVYKRLEKLVNRGDLKTKKVGANARVWWRPLDGSAHESNQRKSETRRSELESSVTEVLERITVGFYALDDQYRFTYVNSRAEDLLDVTEAAVLGHDIHDELSMTDAFEAALEEAYATQELVVLTEYHDPFDAWYESAIYPSASGLSVYVQDISARKRLEHDLRIEKEHFRTALENSPLVAFRLDTDLRYTWIANPHEDFDPEAVVGKRDDELLPPDAAAAIMAPKQRALETGEKVREEVSYELPSGPVTYDFTIAPLRDETGEIIGLTAASLDITERKQRERELQEYQTIVETVGDGIFTVDSTTHFSMVNDAYSGMLGYRPDELIGTHASGVASSEHYLEGKKLRVNLGVGDIAQHELELETKSGETVPVEARFNLLPAAEGDEPGTVVVVRDITERKEQEQKLHETTELLEAERARLETILDRIPVGVWVANEDGELVRKNEAADRIWAGNAPLVERVDEYTEYDSWDADSDRKLTPEEYPLARVLQSSLPVDPVELRIRRFDDTTGWVLVSAAPITDEDGHLEGAVGINVDITERKQREAEITALNHLNSVFQDVTEAVIDSASRAEVEQRITDRLTNSDSYEYAWIGHLDRHGENVVPQTAGTDEPNRSKIALSTETTDPSSMAPIAEAVRTGAVQVSDDSATDPVLTAWNESTESDHTAVASIPITFEERVYGVLNVYTARENAFDENERRILGRFGEVVGHAISSIERKRALLESRVTEVTFQSGELADAYIDAIGDDAFTIAIDKTIVLKDEETISYYSLDGIDPAVFIDVVETFYPESDCHVVSRTGSNSRVEVKTTEETLASRLATYNSLITGGGFENETFRITIHVPQTTDVGKVADLVTEVYPNTDTVAITEFERENPHLSDAVSKLEDELTERQRTTLEVAYYSGFFDWPRVITGEELAERLGITPGTVSHHLRHGERKLLTAFFDSTA